MLSKRRALMAAILVALVAAPAAAADLPPRSEYVPAFSKTAYWLHANGSPLGNLDAQQGKYVRWDATAPAGPTPATYIGNNYDTLVGDPHDPAHFLTMQGKVKGDLDTMAFDLFLVGPSQSTIGCGISLSVQLKIDGETIVDQDYTGSEGFPFTKVDDSTVRTNFVLTHLWEAVQPYKLAYGPEAVHDVYLNLQNFYICNEFVWRYDSAAYPAGFKANLPDTSSYFEFNVTDPPAPIG